MQHNADAPLFQRVMIAADASPASRRALEHAAGLAARHGATLDLVHVEVPYNSDAIDDEAFAAAAEALERARARLGPARRFADADASAHPITSHVIRGVRVGDALLREAEALAADVIVIGTHARIGLGRALLGSVATEVVRGASVPVLVVGPHHDATAGGPSTILAATDFSAPATHALDLAVALAEHDGARLRVVHVTKDWSHPAATLFGADSLHAAFPDMPARARRKLEEQLAARAGAELDVEALITEGPPHRKIVEYARAHGAELIVMAASGHSAVDLVLLGSVTQRVLRTAPCPVLVRGGGAARAEASADNNAAS